MKLRNKKTGEIVKDVSSFDTREFKIGVEYKNNKGYLERTAYDSLAELNAEWEDYDSQEPLIRGERSYEVRTAIRAFGEAIQEKKHILVIKQCGLGMAEFSNGSRFWIRLPLNNETMDALEDRTYYTIDELCGEEEE